MAVANDSLLVYDDDSSLGSQARGVGVVGHGHLLVHVGEQRDRERVLGLEAFMRGEILRGDADDGRIERLEVLRAVAVGAELFRAHHRVVAGIEQEHDALAAVVGEAKRTVRAR